MALLESNHNLKNGCNINLLRLFYFFITNKHLYICKMKQQKLFHLTIKSTGTHSYYSSLSSVFRSNTGLNISKYTLDRYDFSTPYENENIILRKDKIIRNCIKK